MRRFIVIGIDDNRDPLFSVAVLDIIRRGSVFSGGRRHREIMRERLPENHDWIEITVPLDAVFAEYDKYFCKNDFAGEIIVFASGDPLFFGFANTIRARMADAEIKLYPNFNSLQMLAHRLILPYSDMRIVSLTGRPWMEFDKALIEGCEKIGVLTDGVKTPSVIAKRMSYYGYDNYRIVVGVKIGNGEEERILHFSVADLAEYTRLFAMPNNMILIRTRLRNREFGIPECKFELLNNRHKMITKRSVRLVTLSMLDLRSRNTLWDIGFCTGSVSVEAKLQFPHLEIIAFEKRVECLEILDTNCRRFGTPGITPIMGDFIELNIFDIPAPDAIFIGGHGGKMRDILLKIHSVLKDNTVIVFNSVSNDSAAMFEEALPLIGYCVTESTELSSDGHNQIMIMKAERISG